MKKTITTALILAAITSTVVGTSAWANGKIGSANETSTLVTNWCNSSLQVLEEAERQAEMHFVTGQLQYVVRVYRNGFVKAMERDLGKNGINSLTYRSLERGLRLSTMLEQLAQEDIQNGGDPIRGYETLAKFFVEYVKFVKKISVEVDKPMFIPYMTKAAQVSLEDFLKKYEIYAREQLEFVIKNFTKVTQLGDTVLVLPVPSARAYLNLLEHFSKFVADDLKESLLNTKYACLILSAQALNERLCQFNAGDLAVYGARSREDTVYAAQMTYKETNNLLQSLRTRCER